MENSSVFDVSSAPSSQVSYKNPKHLHKLASYKKLLYQSHNYSASLQYFQQQAQVLPQDLGEAI